MLKGNLPQNWQETQNDDYLQLIKSRAVGIELVWVQQMFEIFLKRGGVLSVKDIGCQAFSVYKYIKTHSVNIEYFGYEIEYEYVKIGLSLFPELSDKITIGDFSLIESVVETDLTVISATLEHVDVWGQFLKKALLSTRKTLYLRTFVGGKTVRSEGLLPGAIRPYTIWEFGLKDLLYQIESSGFNVEIRRDEYTMSEPLYLDVEPKKLERSMYVIIANRVSP